jgi:peptidyl-prolyl cis-trans isomerase C
MRLSAGFVVAGFLAAASVAASTVVLQVNGTGITDLELTRMKQALAPPQGQKVDEQALLRRAVDQLIGRALLIQAAREAGITVDPSELRQWMAGQRGRYASAEAYTKALEAAGTSEKEAARHEEEDRLITRFIETKLAPKVNVTPAEARTYYDANPKEFDHPEQVKFRMILLEVPDIAPADVDKAAKERAEAAEARLRSGEDFSKLAAEVSDDPTKTRGGEVGWVRRGQLLPELEAAVFTLQPGEFSQPIRTRFGYHIVGVMERQPAGHSSFDEVQTKLTEMLKGLRVRNDMQHLIDQRRAVAKIETLDPAIKAVLPGPTGS